MPAYRLFALTGVGLGLLVGLVQAARLEVPFRAVLLVAVFGVLGSLAVLTVRAVSGSADWVWHEHEAVVLIAAAGVGLARGDLAPILDVTATGLLVVLGVGRIGCLLAGCCHGRPVSRTRLAVRYSRRHADAGFPGRLVGVALAPVQTIEAIGALLVAVAALTAAGAPPGAIVVAAIGARAGLRAGLEPWRDRPGRRPPAPSTPQLWAAATALVLVTLGAAGLLPIGPWSLVPALVPMLVLVLAGVRAIRSTGPSPAHRRAGIR
ncbi:hypothetical protein GCM10022236_13980 [Microlunatus ginsengisoli]|uniref:Uncharacterized protein n=1 Tax=Microlunatus ginsengisoli TaxID=363863 RepID=A0ABP6ZQ47_9ACTN